MGGNIIIKSRKGPLASVTALAISWQLPLPLKTPPPLSPFFSTSTIVAPETYSLSAGFKSRTYMVVDFLQVKAIKSTNNKTLNIKGCCM
jgi:hypothetical protein